MPSQNSTGGNAGSGHRSAAADPAAAPSRIADLKIRAISALVLGPPVLFAVWYGEWVFDAVIALVALLAAREWTRLVEPDRFPYAMMLALVGVAAVIGADFLWDSEAALIAAITATVLLYGVGRGTGLRHAGLVAFTVPYVALACVALMWLRNDTGGDGFGLFLYLLLVIWGTDIGAYAAGRSIGGPKLMPRISPKKTWAGLIGGMASAAAVGAGVASAMGAQSPLTAACIGAVLAVVGQAGDLFESHMKRRSNVKDSGHLIPGHGGLLDRIDGLIAAAPVLALLYALSEGAWTWW